MLPELLNKLIKVEVQLGSFIPQTVITQSNLGPRIVESTTEHFYAKWHEIHNCPIKYFKII